MTWIWTNWIETLESNTHLQDFQSWWKLLLRCLMSIGQLCCHSTSCSSCCCALVLCRFLALGLAAWRSRGKNIQNEVTDSKLPVDLIVDSFAKHCAAQIHEECSFVQVEGQACQDRIWYCCRGSHVKATQMSSYRDNREYMCLLSRGAWLWFRIFDAELYWVWAYFDACHTGTV